MPRVLIVRGHLANPWELGPWSALSDEYEVGYLLTRSNRFEAEQPFGSVSQVRSHAPRVPNRQARKVSSTSVAIAAISR